LKRTEESLKTGVEDTAETPACQWKILNTAQWLASGIMVDWIGDILPMQHTVPSLI